MQKLDKIHAISAVVAILVAGGALALGVAEMFGAHPFWAVSGSLAGAAIGAVFYLVLSLLNLRLRWVLLFAMGAVFASLATTRFGKFQFAASYAEDALAGQFWYFGWIGAAAAFCLLLALLIQMALTWQKRRAA